MTRGAAVLLFLLLAAPLQASAPALYERALELYTAGQPAEAAPLLERAIREGGEGAAYRVLLGWSRLRLGQLDEAGAAFAEATELAPGDSEARTGLGYVRLRQARVDEAAAAFIGALASDEGNADAWKGLGHVHRRRGEPAAAHIAFERAVAAAPADREAAELFERSLRERGVDEERRPREAVAGGNAPEVRFRAHAGIFERRDARGNWHPFYVKGINLGTALPGRFPAEFPDDPQLYRTWFDQISAMGANAVRLYTLHPPSLYRALHEHNLQRPERKLWLIQGVWATLPEAHDFAAAGYRDALQGELERVIDAVHGNLELPARPGHAHGIYDVDLSGDLLGWILGREWEPFAVEAFNRQASFTSRYDGRYVGANATPFEAWLAWLCDTAVRHQTGHYGVQAPVAFASWPTLDPLTHPTESSRAEEWALQDTEVTAEERAEQAYDEDAVSVDASSLVATPAFAAGLFASYHAYPYYPDFMLLDPEYAGHPRGSYFAYLQALRRHHGEMPVMIAEFGVPSSRGIAHLHPAGLHHGGHDERRQGEIDARLATDIHEAGMAGGIVFAWVDEWFKRNWIVANRQSPAARVPLWFSAQDAEQNFGLLAARPGPEGPPVLVDGSLSDWDGIVPLAARSEGRLRSIRATHDEGWLYLALELSGAVDLAEEAVWIGIDTYDRTRGSRRFPHPDAAEVPSGMEFLVQVDDKGARILVDRPYQVFSGSYLRPWRSVANDRAEFVEMIAAPNRERWTRDGRKYDARTYSRSELRRGTSNPGAADFDSLADWQLDPHRGRLELRIPWGLLHVADPSSRRVVHEQRRKSGVAETVETDGFRFHLLGLRDGAVIDAQSSDRFTWDAWEQPAYHLRTKQSYFEMQRAYRGLPDRPASALTRKTPTPPTTAGRTNRPH